LLRSGLLDATSSRGLLRSRTGESWGSRDERRRMGRSIITSRSIYFDPEDTKRKLAELRDVTHVFSAAFQASSGSAADFASNTGPNREMLVNAVTAINRATPHLKRVVLVTGTKYYGVHLGPLKTPMRETDPRHMPPNYYFDQIDLAHRLSARKRVGLGRASSADAMRLLTRLANEHPTGNRGLCCDI